MIFQFLNRLNARKPFPKASAHCDIPCKIYDPSSAQLAALTVVRMTDMINELESKQPLSLHDQAQLSRLVAQKEEHGIKVKYEVRVIWGDYFKQPQLEAFPEIHELTHNIMLAASKAKQTVDKAAALDLLQKVNRFAEVFWTTKGVNTYTATCPYPPEQSVVYPKLDG